LAHDSWVITVHFNIWIFFQTHLTNSCNRIFTECFERQESWPQSNDWYRWPTELFHHSADIGGARALLVIQLVWFGYIARLNPWGGSFFLLFHMKTTCLRGAYERGGGVSKTMWSGLCTRLYNHWTTQVWTSKDFKRFSLGRVVSV
jgi:hypothetical protein